MTDGERTARLHDDLQHWLLRYQPFTPVAVIVTALMFEVGRLLAATDLDLDQAVETWAATLREQIAAHREGRLKP